MAASCCCEECECTAAGGEGVTIAEVAAAAGCAADAEGVASVEVSDESIAVC